MALTGTHYSLEEEKEKEVAYTTIFILRKISILKISIVHAVVYPAPLYFLLLPFTFLKVSIVVVLMASFWY